MSSFDPENFLNTEFTGVGSTEYVPCPEGEFNAMVKSIKPRVLQDGRPILDVTYIITDSTVQEETGMAEPTVRQTHWLDITESGGLDFGRGKNVSLNRLRDALGQNTGAPWSPGMLVGGAVVVKVAHSIDKRDGKTIQADVKAVSALPF